MPTAQDISTLTDSAGAYTLTKLVAGTYILTASKSGYSFAPARAQSPCRRVPPDQFVGTALTYAIAGHVTDGNGQPIAAVIVTDGRDITAFTDSAGAYTLTGLAAGAYTLTATLSGYSFAPTRARSACHRMPPGRISWARH